MSSDDLKPVALENDSSASAETDDDALILWMLSLTPTQRLEAAQGFVDSVMALRNGRPA
ncbi:MAG TPA: hypothetical protein VIW92_17115 [Thermoanaerobaculia bacterium]